MNMAQWLERAARRDGTRVALMSGGRVVADYAGFRDRAAAVGAALAARGVRPGDRVVLFAQNCPEYLIALYGIWYAGAAAVPINAKLHAKEAAWIVGASEACYGFVSSGCGAALGREVAIALMDMGSDGFAAMGAGPGRAPVSRQPGDLAWLFFTSGTTGQPKGVQITHGMLAATSLSYPLDVDEVRPEDGAYYAAPMSHGAGIYAPIHVRMGARHVVPASGGFDPDALLSLAQTHGPLSMFMAPTMVRRLTDAAQVAGLKGEGIKTVVYGGGPMYLSDIIEAVDWFGARFVQIYGQGECPMAITALGRDEVADRSHPRWRSRLGSVGRAQSAVEVAVLGDAGPVAPGAVGEIAVRGAPVMPGYWRAPEATAKTLQGGWLRTGDLGVLDEDGYLSLVDRSKDVIISGGTNIYPREVEEVLLAHPDVHEVSVVGRPSEEWGEDVVAFVVPRAGQVDPAQLEAHCLDHIARFKRPKAYVQLQELPKNNYGKVLKTELRKRVEEAG